MKRMDIMIQAIFSHSTSTPGCLSYARGDKFAVLDASNDEWYEVKVEGGSIESGFVPKSHFSMPTPVGDLENSKLMKRECLGLALYEFVAVAADELSIRKGDFLKLLATSRDWYLAVNITSTGKDMGLVPMSFVSIDFLNVSEDISQLPSVREWKMANGGEASSNARNNSESSSSGDSTYSSINSSSPDVRSEPPVMIEDMQLPSSCIEDPFSISNTKIMRASVPSCAQRCDSYFIYQVAVELGNGEVYSVGRGYEDFYGLHQVLILQFPKEAGKLTGHNRTLPFLPGPLRQVSKDTSRKRRQELDRYIKELIRMPPHISNNLEVINFLRPNFADVPRRNLRTPPKRASLDAYNHNQQEAISKPIAKPRTTSMLPTARKETRAAMSRLKTVNLSPKADEMPKSAPILSPFNSKLSDHALIPALEKEQARSPDQIQFM
eukprot:Partr_v1_DN28497_c1_g1_i1_m41910